MIMRKTARAAWANIGRGVLLAFTLELPWPHSLHWLWSAVNWASFVMVFGSAAVLFMWGAVNAVRLVEWALTDDPPYECTRDRLLREFREEAALGDRMAVGVNQDGERVYVHVSSLAENRVGSALRYLGPPPVYVPARLPGKSNAVVVHRDATWVFPGGKPAELGHGCLLRSAAPCAPDSSCRCREHGYVRHACDGCGKPLLVSNPLPGTRYTCAACG